MEAVRTSETSVDNYFTRQYSPEDNSERQKIIANILFKGNIIHSVMSLFKYGHFIVSYFSTATNVCHVLILTCTASSPLISG
jgi:hypothetical protein